MTSIVGVLAVLVLILLAGVVTLRLNRPQQLNALSEGLLDVAVQKAPAHHQPRLLQAGPVQRLEHAGAANDRQRDQHPVFAIVVESEILPYRNADDAHQAQHHPGHSLGLAARGFDNECSRGEHGHGHADHPEDVATD